MREEPQIEEHESECKRGLMEANLSETEDPDEIEWPYRPRIAAFCGLREDAGVSLVHERKNQGRDCIDFSPQANQPLHSCETCQHCVQPRGHARDGHLLLDFIRPSNNFYGNAVPEPTPSSSGFTHTITTNIDNLERISGNQESVEMQDALHGGGTMSFQPQCYAYCSKYSKTGSYVLCRVWNHAGRCQGWSEGGQFNQFSRRGGSRGGGWSGSGGGVGGGGGW